MSTSNEHTYHNKHIPLLMTASISTRGMVGANFTDEERENMYASALSFYIDNLLTPESTQSIVFVDNSGWDLKKIKSKLPTYDNSRIEFISLNPNDFDISKGKGYNELLMINKAIDLSESIKESKAFFKVTGRYPIYNIKYFLQQATKKIIQDGYGFYCDTKDHKLYDWLKLGWCGHSFEARLWGASTDFYKKYLVEIYKQCNDYNGNLVEAVVFNFLKSSAGLKIMSRFRREPKFGGVEGSVLNAISFSSNHNSFKAKTKIFVENCIRIFTPWFKF